MSELKRVHVDDISPSPFETRTAVDPVPSVQLLGIITPPKVRPTPGGPKPYELVCGHRRMRGLTGQILCEIQEMDDATAGRMLYFDNEDRKQFTPAERGGYFTKMELLFGWSDEQLSKELGGTISANTIEQDRRHFAWVQDMERKSKDNCGQELGKASDASPQEESGESAPQESAEKTAHENETSSPGKTSEGESKAGFASVTPFSQITKHQREEIKKLPEEMWETVSKRIIDEKFSQQQGLALVAKVAIGVTLDDAVAQVVNSKEKVKEVRYHQKRRREGKKDTNPPGGVFHCPACGDTLLIECYGHSKHKKREEDKF